MDESGVTVVVICCPVWPGAGGCTVVVSVSPFLSTEMTCCGCPVATACFFACSIACSCFDLPQPVTRAAERSVAITHLRTGEGLCLPGWTFIVLGGLISFGVA